MFRGRVGGIQFRSLMDILTGRPVTLSILKYREAKLTVKEIWRRARLWRRNTEWPRRWP
jgi:hypothetical protein